MSRALVLPDPERSTLPAVREAMGRLRAWLPEADDPERVAEYHRQLAAYHRYVRDKATKAVVGNTARLCELRIGALAGPARRKAGPGRGKTVVGDNRFKVEKRHLHDFRLMAAHRTLVEKRLKEAEGGNGRAPRAVSRAELLAAISATKPRSRDLEQTAIVSSLQELIEAGKTFQTIYADPPWKYGNQGTRSATDSQYDTLSVDALCAWPVERVAAKESHLHLWTTNAFLFEAKRVLEAWGFEYKSCFVWVKPKLGIGNYWRVSHEFLLLGIRGGLTFAERSLRSWVQADRTRHSAKPPKVRGLIEKASPAPRLELFGRNSAEGWTVLGNEVQVRLLDADAV